MTEEHYQANRCEALAVNYAAARQTFMQAARSASSERSKRKFVRKARGYNRLVISYRRHAADLRQQSEAYNGV